MKLWIMLLFLMGGTTLGFAQYGSSSGQQYNPYQSGPSQPYGAQSNQQGSFCEGSHLNANEKAFAQRLSKIHQGVFCGHFSAAQRRQAMALVGSPTENTQGQPAAVITPDMAVEIVMQTARYQQGSQAPYSNQQPNPYSNQDQRQSGRSSGRYSNY